MKLPYIAAACLVPFVCVLAFDMYRDGLSFTAPPMESETPPVAEALPAPSLPVAPPAPTRANNNPAPSRPPPEFRDNQKIDAEAQKILGSIEEIFNGASESSSFVEKQDGKNLVVTRSTASGTTIMETYGPERTLLAKIVKRRDGAGATVIYDRVGNVMSYQHESGKNQVEFVTLFPDGRVKQIDLPQGELTYTREYDVDGRLVQSKVE